MMKLLLIAFCFLLIVSCDSKSTSSNESIDIYSEVKNSSIASSSDYSQSSSSRNLSSSSVYAPKNDQICAVVGNSIVCKEATYKTVKIGLQTWMAENLRVGAMIAYEDSKSTMQANESKIEYFCRGNNNDSCALFGGFYYWAEAMDLPNSCNHRPDLCTKQIETNNHQGICPHGWHIPTRIEWETLGSALGGLAVAGSRMKSSQTGYVLWDSWCGAELCNDGNSSGFSAYPTERFNGEYGFGELGINANFWSASVSGYNVTMVNLDWNFTWLRIFPEVEFKANSIRCILDVD